MFQSHIWCGPVRCCCSLYGAGPCGHPFNTCTLRLNLHRSRKTDVPHVNTVAAPYKKRTFMSPRLAFLQSFVYVYVREYYCQHAYHTQFMSSSLPILHFCNRIVVQTERSHTAHIVSRYDVRRIYYASGQSAP